MIVGTVCFSTFQGIAHLAHEFHKHGVIDRVYTVPHPHYAGDPQRYVGDYTRSNQDAFLDGLDVLFLFENGLDWNLVRKARAQGVRIVVMPMFEYSPFPFPAPVDLYICPSLQDMDIYQGLPTKFLTVPVDFPWRQRTQAVQYIHNAGHGQHEYAKGTPELLEAMKLVSSPIHLLVRGQTEEPRMRRLFDRYKGMANVTFVEGTVPSEELYATGDVFVFPERFNGLSLPLQEAYASGMLVMCSDHYPANTWLPDEPLIPVDHYEDYQIVTKFKRAVIKPSDIALTMDAWYGADITEFSLRGKEWAEANSWDVLKPQYLEALAG